MHSVDFAKLPAIFAAAPNVIAAWVFGSAQNGQMREGSDLDIGVLFERYPTLNERLDLADALSRALAFDDIDLVVLNRGSAILRFEALSGRRLYCRDDEAAAAFQSLAAREYEHAMWMVERGLKWHQEALLAQTPA